MLPGKTGKLRGASLALALTGLALFPVLLGANPSGPVVQHGDIGFQFQGDALRIIQSTQRGIVDWNSFSVSSGGSVVFVQPGADAATLNRVTGGTVSRIDGNISANGHVFLLNPNGIVVGRSGSIDAAGFVASTLDLSDEEFLAGGDLRFRGNSEAAVINLGTIGASSGDILLIASTVENDGVLRAPNGTVALAAGNDVLVKEKGSERIFVRGAGGPEKEQGVVNRGTIEANVAELKSYGGNVYGMAVRNEGRVAATAVAREGGQIFLRAPGSGRVSNSGTLLARKPLEKKGGDIVVDAGSRGSAEVAGTVDAGGDGGAGGSVMVLGESVNLFPSSLILADGASGGGSIKIGGGRLGEDLSIPNSIDVSVGRGALLDASAAHQGNGGEVIVFADRSLDFSGFAAVRGGTSGGDGGFVELSGKESIRLGSLTGSVDVSASAGRGGALMIDPNDIFIGPGYSSDDLTSEWSENTILDSDIRDFLLTGDLTIRTNSTATGGTGNITFEFGTSINWNSDYDFSVFADSEVILDGEVSVSALGGGSILLDGMQGVRFQGYYPGSIQVSTQGGDLTIRNDSATEHSFGVSLQNASIMSGNGGIEIVGRWAEGSGSGSEYILFSPGFMLDGTNIGTGVEILDSRIQTTGGDIDISGKSSSGRGIEIVGSGIESSGGDIRFSGEAGGGSDFEGILLDDSGAYSGSSSTIATSGDANIEFVGKGSGNGRAIFFNVAETWEGDGIVEGDGTQDVLFRSEGGDVDVGQITGDEVEFRDPDGIGLRFRMHSGDIARFTAVNVGAVEVENLDRFEVGPVKLATDAVFGTIFEGIDIVGPVEAGRSAEFHIDDRGFGDFTVSGSISAPSILFDGADPSFVSKGESLFIGETEIVYGDGFLQIDDETFPRGSSILVDGSFNLEGVRFGDISEIRGISGSDSILGRSEGDDFRITGRDSGTVNGQRFSSIGSLGGAGGSDIFRFQNQGTLSGGVFGGTGNDALVLDDRNLGGVNRYTIGSSSIERNPSYFFQGVEVIQLLLGPGNDTVVTRGNGLTLLLDGGAGFDTLEMGPGRFLVPGAFVLGGSTIYASDFEAPVGRSDSDLGDPNALLTAQTDNAANAPVLRFSDSKQGRSVDNFTRDQNGSAPTMNSPGPPGGGGFGAGGAAALVSQAVSLVIDEDGYRLDLPASLDGQFALPPIGSIEDLRKNLTPEAWAELAAAIEFQGGMIMVQSDGPYAINLTGLPPEAVVDLLQGNLDFAAALELASALDLALSVPVTSFDGPVGIAATAVEVDPVLAGLLAELLEDSALDELAGAISTE